MSEEMSWIADPEAAFPIFPRSYNPSETDQFLGLIDDHRLTACISFLKYVSKTKMKTSEDRPDSVIQMIMVRFAIDRCQSLLNFHSNDDLDEEDELINKKEWDLFVMHYQRTVQKKIKIVDNLTILQEIKEEINHTLESIYDLMPERKHDGIENMWVVKPWNAALGREIHMIQSLKELSPTILPSSYNKYRYTVQKYIEKPMMIYNTRFDVKRVFLVRSFEPLEVWMFKNYYVQFSTQIIKSGTAKPRDVRIPEHNLWDQRTFQLYLNGIGLLNKWKEMTCPKMTQSAIAAFLCSQQFVKHRKNSFQLIRADYVLTPDLIPWITDLNPLPNMTAGGPVIIKNFTAECLEDMVRVIFDTIESPSAFTGNYELVYKQTLVFTRNSSANLEIDGKSCQAPLREYRREYPLMDVEEANNKLRKQYGLRLIKPAIQLHQSVAIPTLPPSANAISKSMQRLCEPLKLKDIRYHLEPPLFKTKQKLKKRCNSKRSQKMIKTIFKQTSSKKSIPRTLLENDSHVGEEKIRSIESESKTKKKVVVKKKQSTHSINADSIKQYSEMMKKYLEVLKSARESIAQCHAYRDILTI